MNVYSFDEVKEMEIIKNLYERKHKLIQEKTETIQLIQSLKDEYRKQLTIKNLDILRDIEYLQKATNEIDRDIGEITVDIEQRQSKISYQHRISRQKTIEDRAITKPNTFEQQFRTRQIPKELNKQAIPLDTSTIQKLHQRKTLLNDRKQEIARDILDLRSKYKNPDKTLLFKFQNAELQNETMRIDNEINQINQQLGL